jgi:hypothetical protein
MRGVFFEGSEMKLKRMAQVKTMFDSAEVADLDRRRGKMRRGAYLRACAVGRPPSIVPELNHEAWREVSRAAGNLATIATAMRAGHYSELSECRSALTEFKIALLKGTPVSYHNTDSEQDEE